MVHDNNQEMAVHLAERERERTKRANKHAQRIRHK